VCLGDLGFGLRGMGDKIDRLKMRGEVRKVLFIRMSELGDIILTTPVIRALKNCFPAARIDYLTKAQFREVLSGHPLVRKVIGFDSRQGFWGLVRLVQDLRDEHYDLIIDLHINPRSILVRYFSGAWMMRRYRKYSLERRLLKWLRINLLNDAGSVVERYFSALDDFGISPNGALPELYISQADKRTAKEIIEKAGLSGRRLIGLVPGSRRKNKIWPLERFARAGEELAKEFDAGVVILGGEGEQEIGDGVYENLRQAGLERVINLTSKLSIMESSAVIGELDLVISNDTALMHIATAVGAPVVAIFGPTTREMGFFPYSQNALVVERKELKCRPCSLHGGDRCPKQHFKCMLEIEPKEVVEAGTRLLSQKND